MTGDKKGQIRTTVLFFGYTSDLAGCRSFELGLPEGSDATFALSAIERRIPKLAGLKLLFSVNREYAKGAEVIKDGDELAVFTAVSGG